MREIDSRTTHFSPQKKIWEKFNLQKPISCSWFSKLEHCVTIIEEVGAICVTQVKQKELINNGMFDSSEKKDNNAKDRCNFQSLIIKQGNAILLLINLSLAIISSHSLYISLFQDCEPRKEGIMTKCGGCQVSLMITATTTTTLWREKL